MQDIRKKSRWLSFPEMSQRQQKRRRYEELHLRRLEALKKAEEPEEVIAGQLQDLPIFFDVAPITSQMSCNECGCSISGKNYHSYSNSLW